MDKEAKAKYDKNPKQKARRYKYNREHMLEYQRKYQFEYNLKTKYNISIEIYNFMLDQQNHSCAICQQHISVLPTALQVDHNHTTGKVRGLLCGACNRGIGQLKDDIEIVRSAVQYLDKFEKDNIS